MTALKIRPTPLKLGPNFSHADPGVRTALERKIVSTAKALIMAMRKGTLNKAFSGSFEMYAKDFNTDLVAMFSEAIGNGKRPKVLDAGCGLAVASRQIKKEFGDGIDIVPMDMIRFRQEEGCEGLPEVPVVKGILESLPFEDGGIFDLAMLHSSFSFSAAPFATLDEILRVLKPGAFSLFNVDVDPGENSFFSFFSTTFPTLYNLQKVTSQFKNSLPCQAEKNNAAYWPKLDMYFNYNYGDIKGYSFLLEKPFHCVEDGFFTRFASKHNFPQYL